MGFVEMFDVESSNVKKIGYDEVSRNVYVEFKNGNLYAYKDVDREIFEKFKNSPSKGKFVTLLAESYRFHKVEKLAE